MQFPEPKNDRNYLWTVHSRRKLFQYGLSPNVVKRIIRHPDRKEVGIVDKTVAVMKDRSTKSTQREFWAMYQVMGQRKKIISVWIYPGKTKPGNEIYIPDDVWEEINKK